TESGGRSHVWSEWAKTPCRPLDAGATDVEPTQPLVPREEPGMRRAVERDVEKSDRREMREQREIGDRQRSAEVLAAVREGTLEVRVDGGHVLACGLEKS